MPIITRVELFGFSAGVLVTVIVVYILLAKTIQRWVEAVWSKYRSISSSTKITFGLAGVSLLIGIIVTPSRLSPLHLAVFFTILASITGFQDLDQKIQKIQESR